MGYNESIQSSGEEKKEWQNVDYLLHFYPSSHSLKKKNLMSLRYILSTALSTGNIDLTHGKVPGLLELAYTQPCVLLSSILSTCKFPSMHCCLPGAVLCFSGRTRQDVGRLYQVVLVGGEKPWML